MVHICEQFLTWKSLTMLEIKTVEDNILKTLYNRIDTLPTLLKFACQQYGSSSDNRFEVSISKISKHESKSILMFKQKHLLSIMEMENIQR
jgi:hypothetical protein